MFLKSYLVQNLSEMNHIILKKLKIAANEHKFVSKPRKLE